MEKKWIKRIILFLTGQTITLFGSSIVQYAISWHITLTTQSGMMLTIATLCGFLPQVLISLFAGVWADRYSRKKMIILADGMIAVCTAILAVLFFIGYTDIWLLFVISAIRSVGAGIQTPAVSAFIPEIVPQEHLMRVNGLNASITSVMMLLSPAVAGGLYGLMGLQLVFGIDVITAAVGISLLLALKTVPAGQRAAEMGLAPDGRPALEEEPPKQHIFKEMFSGLDYMKKTKWLLQFLGFYLFYALMFGPVVFLTPLMVARSFGPEAWRLVAHEMVFSGGSIVGGLLVGLIGSRMRNRAHMLIWACVVFGVTTFVMGFSPNFWFYLGVMVPMGISMPFINTSVMTILQTSVKPELMGRVFSLVSIVGSTAMPLSMVIFGPLADFMSVEQQLIITGVMMVLISLCMFRFKEVIEVGKNPNMI